MRLWKSEGNVVSPPRAVGSYSRILSWGGSSRCGFKEGCSNVGWRIDGSDWGHGEVRGPLRRLQLSPAPGVIQQEGRAQPFPSPFSSFFTLFLSHVPLPGLQSLSDELRGALHGCLAAPTRLLIWLLLERTQRNEGQTLRAA